MNDGLSRFQQRRSSTCNTKRNDIFLVLMFGNLSCPLKMSNEGSDEGYLSEEFDSEEVAMICHDDRPRASASKTPLHLPVSELPVPRKTNTWNIFKEASVNEKTLSFNDNCLKVAYYKGSGAPSLGK